MPDERSSELCYLLCFCSPTTRITHNYSRVVGLVAATQLARFRPALPLQAIHFTYSLLIRVLQKTRSPVGRRRGFNVGKVVRSNARVADSMRVSNSQCGDVVGSSIGREMSLN
jgi:hypothetical protein